MLNDQFMKWAYQVMVNRFGAEKYKSVTVIMVNNNHKPIYRFELERAFPVKWTGPSFKAGDSAVAVETIELAHHGITYMYLAGGAT
jgi:phage tail-like protein